MAAREWIYTYEVEDMSRIIHGVFIGTHEAFAKYMGENPQIVRWIGEADAESHPAMAKAARWLNSSKEKDKELRQGVEELLAEFAGNARYHQYEQTTAKSDE